MGDITLAGNLPGDDSNGLTAMEDSLVADPGEIRYAVIAFDAMKTTRMTDTGKVSPTVRIRRIEPASAVDDAEEVAKLLDRLAEGRLGTLPLSTAADADDDGEPAPEPRRRARKAVGE